MTLGKMTDADKVMNPQHFGGDPADIWMRIRINLEIWSPFPDHCLVEVRRVAGGLLSLNAM